MPASILEFLISIKIQPVYVLILLTVAVQCEKCPLPKEFTQVHGNTKYLFVDDKMKWEAARAFCRKHATELAKIRSMQEHYLLEIYIDTYVRSSTEATPQDTFWFGANDYNSEGNFRWTTGEDIEFQKFWFHNPNNDRKYTFGKYGEHCVELIYFPNTTESWWNDQSCGQKKPFFCEFPETKFNCFSPPASAGFVDSADLVLIKGTKIYNSGLLQLNWTEAYNYCQEEGLLLITIPDDPTSNQISEVLKHDANNSFRHYWTSGTFFPQCCKNEIQFELLTWQSSGENINFKNATFLTWWDKEPYDQGGAHEENCVEILHTGNGAMDFAASHCSLPMQFLCEEKPGWKEVNAPPELGLSFVIPPKKYFYSDRQYSWSDALVYCKAIGMELVSIETEEENRELHQTLTKKLDLTTCWIWTSGTDMGCGKDEYTWMATGEKMSYFNWQKGFEHTTQEPNVTHCVHVIVHGTGNWNRFPCEGVNNFVCEQRDC